MSSEQERLYALAKQEGHPGQIDVTSVAQMLQLRRDRIALLEQQLASADERAERAEAKAALADEMRQAWLIFDWPQRGDAFFPDWVSRYDALPIPPANAKEEGQ